jgi:hypothetical protein
MANFKKAPFAKNGFAWGRNEQKQRSSCSKSNHNGLLVALNTSFAAGMLSRPGAKQTRAQG